MMQQVPPHRLACEDADVTQCRKNGHAGKRDEPGHTNSGRYRAGPASRRFSTSMALPSFSQSPCCIAFWTATS